jgi:hypothetical protein
MWSGHSCPLPLTLLLTLTGYGPNLWRSEFVPWTSSFSDCRQPSLSRNLEAMDVRLNNREIQAKIDRWVTETGRGPDELIEDAVAGYFEELAQTREMLDSRYDDLKNGRVKPVSGDEVIAHFREKSAARRSPPGSK